MRRTTFALLALLGLMLAAPALAAPQVFVPHPIAENFTEAASVHAADLDGDGDPDVVAAAFVANDIKWWTNRLDEGQDWEPQDIDENFDGARRVFAADLDKDGRVDVIGAASHDDEIAWWENVEESPIRFEKHIIQADFAGARCVHAADVNGDGRLDVLGAADRDDQIVWWENEQNDSLPPADPITWTPHLIEGGFDWATSVHAADIDLDSDVDVLATSFGLDDVILWLNDGADPPGWNRIVVDNNFDGAMQVVVAKIDEDSYPDIVASATTADEIKWWKNDGGDPPDFVPYTIQTGFDRPYEVHAADVDQDGDNDVLAAASSADSIAWFENRLKEGMDWIRDDLGGDFGCALSVFAVKLDSDDDMDVLGAGHCSHEIVWWENRTDDLPPGRIAFVSLRDGDIEIYTMNSDGSDVRRLTDHPGPDSGPAWSPDGTEILFTRGSGQDTTEIWVMDGDGNLIRKVGESHPIVADPRWSPDGSQIVFTIGGHTNKHLYVMQSDGSGLQQIADTCGGEASPDWSPDGSTIVFHADPEGCSYDTADTYLNLVDPDGSNLRPLLDEEGEKIYGSWARYSPDGTLIAFEHAYRYAGGADCDLYVVNSDGGDVRPFQVGPYDDGLPVWSPHGEALAFMSSNRAVTYVDVWVARLDEPDNPIQLTTDPASDIAYDWWGIPPNSPPEVDAGGPFHVDEGGSVMVTAVGSDPDDDPLTYSWDLDHDGTFEAPGQSVAISAEYLDGPDSYTISVQVTDTGDLAATDDADVEVLNVAPTASFINATGMIVQGETATLVFSDQFDPGVDDTAAGFSYSYDCTGDGTFEMVDTTATSFVCDYAESDTFAAVGRIQDKDGGLTDYTAEVVVLSPQEALEEKIDILQGIVDDNPGTDLADKIEDVLAKTETALQELTKTPPDKQAAVGNIEGAVGDLEAAVDDELLDPTVGVALMDQYAAIARQWAAAALDQAIAQGGDSGEICDAREALAEADDLRAAGDFKDAINKYKDALAKAESAIS